MTKPMATWQDRIEIDPARLGGKPVVRGMRITVELVVGMVADGWSQARILDEYPTLAAEDAEAGTPWTADELQAYIDDFREALRSRGQIPLDEERFGDAAALSGVSKFVARVKCAMLAWVAAEDLLTRKAAGS